MTNNFTESLMNITRKEPWLINEDNCYYEERLQNENVEQVLGNIGNHHLAIVAEDGRVFQQSLTLRLTDDTILIDRPLEWDDSISSFHAFFRRDGNDIQHFFRVNKSKSDLKTISAKKPGNIFLLQKRRYRRTLAPVGSKIIFRDDSNQIDSACIHDISKGGMLVWTSDSTSQHMVNSILHDVFISVPIKEELEGSKSTHRTRVLPYITKGKIVRRNTDQSPAKSQYGISFLHESDLIDRKFTSLISQLQNNCSARNIHEK